MTEGGEVECGCPAGRLGPDCALIACTPGFCANGGRCTLPAPPEEPICICPPCSQARVTNGSD